MVYDPDNDDYQMQVKPEVPEAIAQMETELINKQVAQLQVRIDQGGLIWSFFIFFLEYLRIVRDLYITMAYRIKFQGDVQENGHSDRLTFEWFT